MTNTAQIFRFARILVIAIGITIVLMWIMSEIAIRMGEATAPSVLSAFSKFQNVVDADSQATTKRLQNDVSDAIPPEGAVEIDLPDLPLLYLKDNVMRRYNLSLRVTFSDPEEVKAVVSENADFFFILRECFSSAMNYTLGERIAQKQPISIEELIASAQSQMLSRLNIDPDTVLILNDLPEILETEAPKGL